MPLRRLVSSTLVLATTVLAQLNGAVSDLNTIVPLNTCRNLTCGGNNGVGACYYNSRDEYGVGVGIYPTAIRLDSSTNLSVTLLDGFAEGRNYRISKFNTWETTHKLNIGAPPDFNLTAANPACALTLLSNAQTFLEPSGFDDAPWANKTSWCPGESDEYGGFSHPQLRNLASLVRDFRYVRQDTTNATQLPRCEALAAYVEIQLQQQTVSSGYNILSNTGASALNIIGGAIAGPDAPTVPVSEQDYETKECQPVLPQDYTLYNVSQSTLVLDEKLDVEDPYRGAHYYGGRTGFTMLVTAVYDDDDGSHDPDVQIMCLKTPNPAGETLPFQALAYESGADAVVRGFSSAGSVAVAGLVWLALWI